MAKRKSRLNKITEIGQPTEEKKKKKVKPKKIKQKKAKKERAVKSGKPDNPKEKKGFGHLPAVLVVIIGLLFAGFTVGWLNKELVVLLPEDSAKIHCVNPLLNAVGSYSSMDPEIASVDADGNITAKETGIVTIALKTPIKRFYCRVHVVGFKKQTDPYVSGYTYGTPSVGTTNSVKWSSSDKGVAEITKSGAINALKPGEATITGIDHGKKFTTRIKIIGIIAETDTVFAGNEKQLTVSDEVKDKIKSWSVDNEDLAVIDEKGLLTPLAPGTVKVTCDVGDKSPLFYSFNIIGLKENEFHLKPKKEAQIAFSGSSADQIQATYKSNNPEIATVNEDGLVTGIAPGETDIVVSSGKDKIKCHVAVVELKDIIIARGHSRPIKMENYNGDDITFTTEDDGIAAIDGTNITAVDTGYTTITASTSEMELEATVYVVDLNETSFTMEEGKHNSITMTGVPEKTTVKYKSEDKAVATVDDNGRILGVKEGTTSIAINVGGQEKMEVLVTVVKRGASVTEAQTNETQEAEETSEAGSSEQTDTTETTDEN